MSLPNDAAARKAVPIASGFFDYFPDAIVEVAKLSAKGNAQHNGDSPLHWDRSKSTDHADCLMRHFMQRGTFDVDGVPHSVKVLWRAAAIAQLEEEERRGLPVPRGARAPAPKECDWIEWRGGACPLTKGCVADIRTRGGTELCGTVGDKWPSFWQHTDSPWDIVAYRVVKESE